LTDGFVSVIRQKAGKAFEAVGGKITPEVAPEVTPEVTPEVKKMLSIMKGEMARSEIMSALGLTDEKHFREHYQKVCIRLGLIEMTIPDKPRSSKQKYRLTGKGKQYSRQITLKDES
jgi:hypothetical protein